MYDDNFQQDMESRKENPTFVERISDLYSAVRKRFSADVREARQFMRYHAKKKEFAIAAEIAKELGLERLVRRYSRKEYEWRNK